MRRLLDVLLTTESAQRTRLVQAAMVLVALSVAALALLVLAAAGVAPVRPVLLWALVVPVGMLAIFIAIRSGWSRRFEDPSLTMAQIIGGSAACALAYGLAGPARGGVFLVLMVVLMGAMLSATPRQMHWGSLFALVALGAAMLHRALQQQALGWPWTETVLFLLVLTMLPAASVLTARLAAMRQRSRRQQQDLEAALVRIRELATRDELTGLVNRRHMRDLMEQEHQRCIRSGRSFCMAVLDIDHFKAINETHSRSVGDAVLRSVAHEAMRRVRVSDAFARWGGDRFVLLLSDARGPLARGGVERVRNGIGQMHVAIAAGELRLTLSAGMAEHHAGETVEQTLDRAERALQEAKQQGRDRLAGAV
ncbi:MAG: GGDEF domain-containing protein [Rubrivivax sp.]|nr:GGDEF domain-containing protein [Rubrivivax sp.]